MVPHDSKSDLPLTTISVMCNADSVVSKHEELASEKILSHCECVGGVFLKLLLRVRRIAFANTHYTKQWQHNEVDFHMQLLFCLQLSKARGQVISTQPQIEVKFTAACTGGNTQLASLL